MPTVIIPPTDVSPNTGTGSEVLSTGATLTSPILVTPNIGAATGTSLTLTGNVTASDSILGTSGPSVKSSLSARAPRQGLVFDGSAGATGTAVTIGTADLTFSQWVRVPSTVSETRGLFLFSPAGSIGATSLLGYVDSDATLNIHITGATSGDRTKQTLSGFVTSYAGKWVNILFTRVGSTWTGYINGVATTFSASTSGTAPTWAGSISGAVVNFGSLGSSGAIYNDAISAINLYNRALSASEVVSLYEAGAPAGADYNSASSTNIITGDAWYTTVQSGTAISSGVATITTPGNLLGRATAVTVGKRYRVSVNITASTGGAVVRLFEITTGTNRVIGSAAGTNTLEFTATSADQYFNISAGTATFNTISLIPLGLLLSPDAAQAGGGLVWYDTSGNAANITLPASGVNWNVPSSAKVATGWAFGGNVGIGSTSIPAWSSHNVLQTSDLASFGSFTGNKNAQVMHNAFWNGSAYKYIETAASSYYAQTAGVHSWFTAASGTAGNTITFAEAARIFANGNFGIGTGGTDGGQKLQVSGTSNFSNPGSSTIANFTNSANADFQIVLTASTSAKIGPSTPTSLILQTNGTTALTLDSSQRAIFSPARAASNLAVKIISSGAATNADRNFLLFGHNTAANAAVISQIDNTTTGAMSLILASGTDSTGAAAALTLDSSQNATFAGNVKPLNFSTAVGVTQTASTATTGVNIGFDGNVENGWIQATRNSNAETRVLQINPLGGNVLIGKSTPDTGEKLQVSGTIAASLGVSSNGALAAYPAANSAAMDWYGGYARFWGVGADASTAGGIKLIVSSTDGSPAVDALTIVSSGDATFAGAVTAGGNVNLAVGKLLTLNGNATAGSYALQAATAGAPYDFRIIGASDSGTQRYFSFGYYTGDNIANAWNEKARINSYTGDATFVGSIAIGNTVNTVSPTSPNRTITMVIGGTTYYIHAKTTND